MTERRGSLRWKISLEKNLSFVKLLKQTCRIILVTKNDNKSDVLVKVAIEWVESCYREGVQIETIIFVMGETSDIILF